VDWGTVSYADGTPYNFGNDRRGRDLICRSVQQACESLEDPMPNPVDRYAQLTSAQTDTRRLLADRSLTGASTDELRVIVDKLVEIDRQLIEVATPPRVPPPPPSEIEVTAFDEA
jgi:hypothetical protein